MGMRGGAQCCGDDVWVAFGTELREEVGGFWEGAFEVGEPLFEATSASFPWHGVFAGVPELKEGGLDVSPGNRPYATCGAVLRLGVGEVNGGGESWVGDHSSTQHQVFATGRISACDGVLDGPDISVGDDAEVDMFFDILDSVPVGWGLVALKFGASVDDEFGGASGFDGACALFCAGIVTDAEPHFSGDDGAGGECVSHGADNPLEGLGGIQKRCSAAVTVHGFCGAAEVDVDTEGP